MLKCSFMVWVQIFLIAIKLAIGIWIAWHKSAHNFTLRLDIDGAEICFWDKARAQRHCCLPHCCGRVEANQLAAVCTCKFMTDLHAHTSTRVCHSNCNCNCNSNCQWNWNWNRNCICCRLILLAIRVARMYVYIWILIYISVCI